MDFQISTETSDPEDKFNIRGQSPLTESNDMTIEDGILKHEGISDDYRYPSLGLLTTPSDDLDDGQKPIVMATARPTRESVLQRLSEALLRRSLTKVSISICIYH
jgi:hypothetical protein